MAKIFNNIQKTMFEMKAALLNNENIRKLLVYDQKNALSQQAPTIDDASEHITFFPISEMGIKNYTQNTLINISCRLLDNDTETDQGSIYVGFILTMISTKQVWELENYKLRLIELGAEIQETLNNHKFSLPLPLVVLQLEDVVFDADRAGYIIKIDSEDLQKEVSL